MVHTCSVYGCLSTAKNNRDLKFHRFPRDARCQSWIDACKRPDLKDKSVQQLYNLYVCSLHFEKWMYMKTKLKSAAIPVSNLPSAAINPSSTHTEDKIADTARDSHGGDAENQVDGTSVEVYVALSTNASTQTTRKRKIKKETWDKKLKHIEDAKSTDVPQLQFLQECDIFLPSNPSKAGQKQVDGTSTEISVETSAGASTQTTKPLTDPIRRKGTCRKQVETGDKKLKLIEDAKSTDITREQFIQACDKFLSPRLSEIVKKELNLRHPES